MKRLLVLIAVLVISGCVTHRDKVAIQRTVKVLDARGAAGDEQAAAGALELAQVALDVGADRVSQVEVVVTPAAALENAQGIARERGEREAIVTTAGSWLTSLLGLIPGGVALGSAAGGLWALWRKGQLQKAATLAVGTLNDFKHLTERVTEAIAKPDAETDWTGLATDAADLLENLKLSGQAGSAAWKELSAIHAAITAKSAPQA